MKKPSRKALFSPKKLDSFRPQSKCALGLTFWYKTDDGNVWENPIWADRRSHVDMLGARCTSIIPGARQTKIGEPK